MLLTGHPQAFLGTVATESSGFLRRTPQWWDSMKYIYNPLCLFMIMLSVIWFRTGSSASEIAATASSDAQRDANVEQCSLRQSEAGLSSQVASRDE